MKFSIWLEIRKFVFVLVRSLVFFMVLERFPEILRSIEVVYVGEILRSRSGHETKLFFDFFLKIFDLGGINRQEKIFERGGLLRRRQFSFLVVALGILSSASFWRGNQVGGLSRRSTFCLLRRPRRLKHCGYECFS